MMRIGNLLRQMVVLMSLSMLIGCSIAFDMALTGAGKSAQIEPINFFKTTDDLKPPTGQKGDWPDFCYIAPNVQWSKYNRIVVNDFTSLTSDVRKISGLQIPEFKNIRKDIPDNIAQSLDGGTLPQCSRADRRIDHNNIADIKSSKGDAILFGNISEIRTGARSERGGVLGLTATQVEMKLVDRKTGQELIKIVNRSSTDGDKVSMPIVSRLATVVNKAKNGN